MHTTSLGRIASLLFINAVASGPGTAAAATPDPLFPAGLEWKAGPTCTYDIDHNGKKARWTSSVTEATGDQIKGTWTREAGGPSVSVPIVKTEKGAKFTEELSLVHGTPMVAEPAYQWLTFPLEPKKSWSGRSVFTGSDAAGKSWKVEVKYESNVGDWEKLKTPAGETQALKIVSDEKIAGVGVSFSGTGRTTTWVGPGACSVKKVEYKNSFKEAATLVLVAEGSR